MKNAGFEGTDDRRLAIMQPYFFPYIGYFQLIAGADRFVVYDNIKYTKKGWINRNRMLRNGQDVSFSLPLKRDSDHLDIRDRELAESFNRDKLLNQLKGAYQRAPQFSDTFPLVEEIVRHEEVNLFHFLHNSILKTCEHLGIATPIDVSSDLQIDRELKSQDRVIATCKAYNARAYVNPIGGIELYSKEAFLEEGIDLQFMRTLPVEYAQFGETFVPNLSIIDVMMFNSVGTIQSWISNNRELI